MSQTDSESPVQEKKSLDELLRTANDQARVEGYLAELGKRHPGFLARAAAHDDYARWLVAIFGFSRFLSEELLRYPEHLFAINSIEQKLSAADYGVRLQAFLDEREATSLSPLHLASFRRLELMRIVVRDALAIASVAEITEELSNMADAIVAYALDGVLTEVAAKYGLPTIRLGDALRPAPFTVIALGKLGGCELNYSSDIDLMFLYGASNSEDSAAKITDKEFFKKVANRLTELLSTYTAAGLCYRVDLRLRPEGSLGDVCISLKGAQDYYATRARDWELQMLIKARVAAGDPALGAAFLQPLESTIYSTTLDFSTIESMSATRERIGEKLRAKRLRQGELNVKLAPGGIRDIEFLVQCLQRLHGAREPWVRHGGTFLALNRLLDKDLLSSTEYSRLSHAYLFLRNLEHRLQAEHDRQTHSLPESAEELTSLARRMTSVMDGGSNGERRTADLLGELNRHLENVRAIYERIVHAQRPLYYSNHAEAAELESVWEQSPGKNVRTFDAGLLAKLEVAAPWLADRLRQGGMRREHQSFEALLRTLFDHPPLLASLNSNPVLASYLIRIFEVSPFLSDQIKCEPDLLEEVRKVADHPHRRPAFEGLAAPLNDVAALHRFFRREMMRIQAASICLEEPIFQTLDRTSALAEFLIARAYRIALEGALGHAASRATAERPFVEPENEMMVVALGRLGLREFDIGSDADVLFIIPDSEDRRMRFWTRVAEHLIEILSAYTGRGAIVSLDTRLRPNGREGMLVQTESTYKDYFASKAEAWEGIAYMKARAVAGDIERSTVFLSDLQQVDWRRYGQSGRSKQDLRRMRTRLEREQGDGNKLKSGHGGYYDADFILMYLRLKGAGLFFKSLNTLERIDIVEKMGHLECADANFLLRATTYYRSLDHALRILTGRSGDKLPEDEKQQEIIGELTRYWSSEQSSNKPLLTELREMQGQMRRLFDRIFY